MIQDDLYLFNHHHKIFKAGPVYKQIFYFSMEVHGSMALCKLYLVLLTLSTDMDTHY